MHVVACCEKCCILTYCNQLRHILPDRSSGGCNFILLLIIVERYPSGPRSGGCDFISVMAVVSLVTWAEGPLVRAGLSPTGLIPFSSSGRPCPVAEHGWIHLSIYGSDIVPFIPLPMWVILFGSTVVLPFRNLHQSDQQGGVCILRWC